MPEIAPEAPTTGISDDEKTSEWKSVAATPVARYQNR
jgi:hypothetical protein